MTLLFTNNAQSTLASGITNSATSIAVAAGQGALFPSPSGGDTFRATLVRASDGAIEIVDVTTRSTDTLTVTRAQEGTTGLAFVTGDRIECRITAAFLNNQNVAIQTHAATSKATPVDADELPLADSAASFGLKKLTWSNIKATLATWLAGGTIAGSFTSLSASGNTALGDAEASDTHAIKGATTVLANSASAALTVTQTGAGNAFVVEDSASPDSTPFVIDGSGNVGIGSSPITQGLSITAGSAFGPQVIIRSTPNDATSGYVLFEKARATSITQSGDTLGNVQFRGYDGASYVDAARIRAEVDGTPGTNDMPGRLVFSTTADGASSPTERMRIDSSGNVGIGGVAAAGNSVVSYKAMTGGGYTYGFNNIAQIASDVASEAVSFSSYLSTQAASFTAANIRHFKAVQSTIGAGSTVTNQSGFFVDSTLTGATNNYGFYSNIAAAANRYNFYAAGSADNYLAGRLGIGSLPYAGVNLIVNKNLTGATGSQNILVASTVQSDVTSLATGITSTIGTQAASFTLTDLAHFRAAQGTIGAGSTVTNQYGFLATAGLTGATNNYGFYGNIPAGANRYNFYAAGTAYNYFAGNVGIGALPYAGTDVVIGKALTGATSGYGMFIPPTVNSDVTSAAYGINTYIGTQAASFTLPILYHFSASQNVIGAGSTVANQRGFNVASGLTGATNNYGFFGNIAAGANRWNFYAAGTANNAYAGNSSFGKVTVPTSAVDTTSLAAGFATSSSATCTVGATDHTIVQTTAASTYTLPSAASFPGRILKLLTQFAGTVVSASSNVVPIAGGAAGTAILAATAGKYAVLQSNGTNWQITEAN